MTLADTTDHRDAHPDWLVAESLAPSLEPGDPVAALYAAAAQGILALPFCDRCDRTLELEQTVCDGCLGTAVVWRPVQRRGRVHAVTTVHRREPGLIVYDQPYPVLDVEVVSGHRLIMTTVEPVAETPEIGQLVDIVFRHVAAVAVPAACISHTSPHPDTEALS